MKCTYCGRKTEHLLMVKGKPYCSHCFCLCRHCGKLITADRAFHIDDDTFVCYRCCTPYVLQSIFWTIVMFTAILAPIAIVQLLFA